MTSHSLPRSRPVLADALPGGAVRDVGLVVGAAVFVGLFAQISVPLPFTPVPLSGSTFAVLLAGAALGPARAALGMLVYGLVGGLGVPWFSAGAAGFTIPSFGYVVGFLLAAAAVGALARRGADRSVAGTFGLMIAGNVIIYAAAVPWLMVALGIDLPRALAIGVLPFLIGDAIKSLLAAGLLPTAWRLIARP